MNDKIMGWLQVIGNFGLILGLVLVGIQINQNSNIARAQMAHDGWIMGSETNLAQVGDNPAPLLTKLNFGTNQLTDEELTAADAYYRYFASSINRMEHMNSLGLEIYSIEQAAQMFVPYFTEGFGRIWWEQYRNSLSASAPHISERINELIESGNSESIQYRLSELKRKSASNK